MSSEHSASVITPFPLAMVICDFAYRDPYSGKYSLTGIFSNINSASFPVRLPHVFVYSALVGGRGRIPLRLEITHSDDEAPFAIANGVVDAKSDPRIVLEIVLGFKDLVIVKSGEYRISLFANDEFMVERGLVAVDTRLLGEET